MPSVSAGISENNWYLPTGYLLIGMNVDDQVMSEIAQIANTNVTFKIGEEIVASSLGNDGNSRSILLEDVKSNSGKAELSKHGTLCISFKIRTGLSKKTLPI